METLNATSSSGSRVVVLIRPFFPWDIVVIIGCGTGRTLGYRNNCGTRGSPRASTSTSTRPIHMASISRTIPYEKRGDDLGCT